MGNRQTNAIANHGDIWACIRGVAWWEAPKLRSLLEKAWSGWAAKLTHGALDIGRECWLDWGWKKDWVFQGMLRKLGNTLCKVLDWRYDYEESRSDHVLTGYG